MNATTLGHPCAKCGGPTRGLNSLEGVDASSSFEVEYCPFCNETWNFVDGKAFGRLVPVLHEFIGD